MMVFKSQHILRLVWLLPLVQSVEIAYDMVNSGSSNLIVHTNTWEGAFSSSQDGFQKYSRATSSSIPNALLDEGGSDAYGIVTPTNEDEFFGIADLINNQNSGICTAEWEFNVIGYENLQVSIDMAAMGDFEHRNNGLDYFKWFARFDGQTMAEAQEVWYAQSDRTDSQSYTLSSGLVTTLNDPLEINCCGAGATQLNNVFQTFTESLSGQGSVLKLTLEARTNGGNEAMAFQNIRITGDADICGPDDFCGNEVVTTMTPDACDPSGLSSMTLQSYVAAGETDVLVTLRGPSDPADASAVIISAAHGGALKPAYIPDRSETGPYCPSSGCRVLADSNTKQIALELQNKIIQKYCKVPYVIVNELHRSKLDANREIGEAAHGHPIAEDAWQHFHDYIAQAQTLVMQQKGTATGSTGLVGIKGLLFDIHGYYGSDWNATDGGYFIQWGYRFSDNSLDPNEYCPLDTRSSGTAGTYTHARWVPPEPTPDSRLECLVRGPGSLGSRVPPLTDLGLCGAGMPSQTYPSPKELMESCTYCEDMCENDPDPCHYYNGGFDVDVHEFIDWENKIGTMCNTVQAELPRCIRFNSTTWSEITDSLSIGICSFVGDLFGVSTC